MWQQVERDIPEAGGKMEIDEALSIESVSEGDQVSRCSTTSGGFVRRTNDGHGRQRNQPHQGRRAPGWGQGSG